MRKLKTSDIFEALRLIKKANIKEELRPVIALAAEGNLSVADIGIEGLLTIVEIFAAKNSEQAIYEFLAGPFEMTPEEVESLELMQLSEYLGALSENSDLKSFFMALQGMIIKKS